MTNINIFQKQFPAVLIGMAVFLSGCAVKNKEDPLEQYNRAMYKINKAVDRVVLKPVAQVYVVVIPKPIRIGVSNFYQNLRTIPTIINDALQNDPTSFYNDFARLILNSTLGIGGIFDIAETAGIEKSDNDFGITLGHWGYTHSTYIVLPFYGPSTFRDGIGLVATYYMSVWPYIPNNIRVHHHKAVAIRNGLLIGDVIDTRAGLLDTESIIESSAVDEYAFIRDAYLQHRLYEIEAGVSAPSSGPMTLPTDVLEGPPE
jgi:phospholipid-binding lipoprotein MlaA